MRVNKRKAILLTALGGLGLVFWDFQYRSPSVPTVSSGSSIIAAQPAKSDVSSLEPSLPKRPTLGGPVGTLFNSDAWQPPAPEKIIAAPATPSPPPMPYRFAGRLVRDGILQIYLAKGNAVISIKEGQTLDGGYRVESIGQDIATLVYLPLNHKESVALRYGPATTTTRPLAAVTEREEAQLAGDLGRWDELTSEQRRQISERLRQIPASPARDRLFKQYALQGRRVPSGTR